ncbi:tumor necrosis factor receptor superfamily member 11B isoform X2 [Centroberyx affinis]|uniref:tumor necrosis factor receptor superfamily member 11B isoform X2 n=1 Tax=Centroberyx affinis TaxID=166261 RepID=UPI003A5BBE90
MVLLKCKILLTLICAFTFSEPLRAFGDYIKCPEGQRVSRTKRGKCEPCPDGQYQPVENDSQECFACTKCDEETGSEVESACSKIRDTECRCRPGFVTWENDLASCKCEEGSGLQNTGRSSECHKCEDGFFSNKIDSPCRKWKECKSGVKYNGTKISDVVCNDEQSRTTPDAASRTTKSASLSTHYMSRAPDVKTQTQELPQRRPTILIPGPVVPTEDTPNNKEVSLLLAFGIIGLLILTMVTCKLNIIPCIQSRKKPAVKGFSVSEAS